MDPLNPPIRCMDRSDCDKLNQLLASCAETGQVLDALTECGLDYGEQLRRNQFQQAIAQKLKAKFFPNEP